MHVITLPRAERVTGRAPWVRLVRERRPDATDSDTLAAPCRTPREAADILRPTLESEEQEVFCTLILNAQHRVAARVEVTRGTLNASLVHPREVFRVAVALNAAAIILGHNHPSGDPTPSAEDREVTAQLVAAGRILDIPVHDHIIIGDRTRYVSFAEAGWL